MQTRTIQEAGCNDHLNEVPGQAFPFHGQHIVLPGGRSAAKKEFRQCQLHLHAVSTPMTHGVAIRTQHPHAATA